MADIESTPAPAAPVAPPAPVAQPAQHPAGEEYRAMPPEAFKARLAEERETARRAALKELGVESIKDARAALDKLKERETAEMSESQKLAAKVAELEGPAKQAAAQREVLEKYAGREFAALPESFQKYIAAVAGDDPLQRLRFIDEARASGIITFPSPAAPVPAPAPTPPPPPASTSAAGTAPTPPPPSALSPKALYEQLKTSGQKIAAAHYYAQHRNAIENASP